MVTPFCGAQELSEGAAQELPELIKTAQKLIETWEEDPDNYSQLEEGLTAMKAELDKFKN